MDNRKSFQLPSTDDVKSLKDKCLEFLRSYLDDSGNKYLYQLQDIANRERKLLEVNMGDISEYNIELYDTVKLNTFRCIQYFEEAAEQLMPAPNVDNLAQDVIDVITSQRIASTITGAQADTTNNAEGLDQQPHDMESQLHPPKAYTRRFTVCMIPGYSEPARKLRDVKAADIGRLVCIKGIVTRASDVKPHIVVCTYICDTCSAEIFHEINDPIYMPLVECPSKRCKGNNSNGKLFMQIRGSRFIKYQELRIQELPDQVPVGHIPRAMTVKCRGELTRQCGPGDIITISGIFSTVKNRGYNAIRAGLQTETYLEASNIEKQKKGYDDLVMDDETVMLVKGIANDPDPYSKLAKSIAPEIYGHEDVKKALLLQLISGVTRTLPDGMKIRGDINICLMGDPGVAKSQLLKHIASVAPRGHYTTGKGSSGVGLTAAVVKDPLSGDIALEGGALVLADMGICCIDEFDKMDESDRTAIHEVMEQQTISIAKAGITTRLNARAAVLAAANPLYGRYNRRKSISENVDLPNSLLSRFDLLFLILDKADMEQDLNLSRHVLHVHKFLKNPDQAFVPLLPSVIKQYVAAARTIVPTVPQQLESYITEAYVDLRVRDAAGTGPGASKHGNDQATMTARQLLSILRLSQALARLRLSRTISHQDIDEAIRLIHASKSSLLDDSKGNQREDFISSIFNLIRDYSQLHNTIDVSYSLIEAMVLNSGFTSNQLQATLQEYSNLGIIDVDRDGMTISIHS